MKSALKLGLLALLVAVSSLSWAPLSWGGPKSKGVDRLHLEKLLTKTQVMAQPGDIRGLLVPAKDDQAHLEIAAGGYSLLYKPRFKTVLILYRAASQEQPGGYMPVANYVDTPFGSLELDGNLQDALLQSSTYFQLSDSTGAWSPSLQTHLNLLKHMVAKKRVKALPLGLVLEDDKESSKEIALRISKAVEAAGYKKEQLFVLMLADLSSGFSRRKAALMDSQVLTYLESLSGNELLDLADRVRDEVEGIRLEWGPLLVGNFLLNRFFVNRGRPILYANTGQFPLVKREAQENVDGMASMAFYYADQEEVKISKDRSRSLAEKLPRPLLGLLLKEGRFAIDMAMDPSAIAPRPVKDRVLQAAYPVFVSLFKDEKLVGQSGTIKAHGPLEEAVKYHAVQAALHDPHHSPVGKTEMESVMLGLAVPSSPKIVFPQSIVSLRDGVMLRYRNRENVFLHDAWRLYPHPYVLLSELTAQMDLEPWRWRSAGAKLYAFQMVHAREGEQGQEEDQDIDLRTLFRR